MISNEIENTTLEKRVNLEDIAIHLSMSEGTVRTWVKEGKLLFYRVGNHYNQNLSSG
jgi:hypothetical protein